MEGGAASSRQRSRGFGSRGRRYSRKSAYTMAHQTHGLTLRLSASDCADECLRGGEQRQLEGPTPLSSQLTKKATSDFRDFLRIFPPDTPDTLSPASLTAQKQNIRGLFNFVHIDNTSTLEVRRSAATEQAVEESRRPAVGSLPKRSVSSWVTWAAGLGLGQRERLLARQNANRPAAVA